MNADNVELIVGQKVRHVNGKIGHVTKINYDGSVSWKCCGNRFVSQPSELTDISKEIPRWRKVAQ